MDETASLSLESISQAKYPYSSYNMEFIDSINYMLYDIWVMNVLTDQSFEITYTFLHFAAQNWYHCVCLLLWMKWMNDKLHFMSLTYRYATCVMEHRFLNLEVVCAAGFDARAGVQGEEDEPGPGLWRQAAERWTPSQEDCGGRT